MLRNETFFKMNRFYLVGSALFSLVIPAMKADWVNDLFITEKVQGFTQSITYAVITPGIEQLNVTSAPSPDQLLVNKAGMALANLCSSEPWCSWSTSLESFIR